jgi:hypothetical protein
MREKNVPELYITANPDAAASLLYATLTPRASSKHKSAKQINKKLMMYMF